MGNENGTWIMHGAAEDDPCRLRSPEELIDCVNRLGFLPLFANELAGFSVEERTLGRDWWTDDPARDPWAWRKTVAAGGQVAYGKFFGKRAGFISLDWFPCFANFRRDGYDFDARWEDGKARHRSKKLMDLFENGEELFSFQLRRLAGFGKDGERNFEGVITEMQMQTYLVIRDFRCRRNKGGAPYGWPVAVYTKPESLWGYELVAAAYGEPPEASRRRVYARAAELCPEASAQALGRVLG